MIDKPKLLHLSPFLIGALLILSTSKSAVACSCRGAERPPCVAFREASAVFSGVVTDAEGAPPIPGDTFRFLLIRFSVETAYKGVSESEVLVSTPTGTSCDYGFQTGGRYFVYAYRDSRRNNRLFAGACSSTKRLSYAGEDVEYAKGLSRSSPLTSLIGADNEISSPLNESEIVVEGAGRIYKAIVDSRGAFKIELARGGRYEVKVIGPHGQLFLNHYDSWKVSSVNGRPVVQFELVVSDGQCEFIDFSLHLTVRKERVAGRARPASR